MKPTMQCGLWRFLATLALLGGAAAFAGLPARAQEQLPPGITAGSDQTRTIELMVEGELARRLAPADRWEVSISASAAALEAGRLPKVRVRAWNLRLPDGQVIAELALTAENLQIDLRRSRLVSSGKLSVLARFRPEDMASFVEQKAERKMRKLRIKVRGDQVDIRCSVHAGPFWVPMHCVGRAYVEGNAVYTWATRHTVAGISLPRSIRRRIKRKIDPIVDGSALPVPVRFERLGTAGDMLEVGISLELADLPEQLPPHTRP